MGRIANPVLGPNVERRGRRLFVALTVPKDVRAVIGKTRYIKALDTDSPSVARGRAATWVAQWKAEISAARARLTGEMDQDAAYWRRALIRARTEDERIALEARVMDMALDRAGGADRVERGAGDPVAEEGARRWYAAAMGIATDAHLDDWIATLEDTTKTKDMKRADVAQLAKRFPLLADITKKGVQQFCTSRVQDDGVARATIVRSLSSWRGYWRYLQSLEVADENIQPFTGLSFANGNHGKREGKKRKPFDAVDVVKLRAQAKARGDEELADIIEIGMYTGARIEELAALPVAAVNLAQDYFDVGDAKTPAGIRQVPIHPEVTATLKRLIGGRGEGYVFAGLTTNKYGDRSNAVGKRFGRLKRSLGYGEDLVFHSIRRTVATMLENAGVAEGVAADIIGHEKPTMTYGLYSGGASLQVKAKAIRKLVYPTG